MKKITITLTAIVLMAWVCPAMAQSALDGKLCQFYNIDKSVKAKLGEGEDAAYQHNSIKALWPVMLNGKECTKLQEALCLSLTGKDNIKQLDDLIDYVLYTDNEGVPFKESSVSYQILDKFVDVEGFISSFTSTTELKSLGKRFAIFHQFFNMYFAGAAHGTYSHNYITYDTQLGKVVTLEDILIDPELIRPHILQSIKLTFDYTEEDLFLPEDNTPHVPSVFYFENGMLHLVYQVYEIASYAQGVIDVPLYYHYNEEYSDILTPYGQELFKESFEEDSL